MHLWGICVYIHTHLCNVHKYSLRRSSQTAGVPLIWVKVNSLPQKKKKKSSCCLCGTRSHITGGCFSSIIAICVWIFTPEMCVLSYQYFSTFWEVCLLPNTHTYHEQWKILIYANFALIVKEGLWSWLIFNSAWLMIFSTMDRFFF